VLTVTVFRILLVIVTGISLFYCMLYSFGWSNGRHLKKRGKLSAKEREGVKAKIVLIYFFALCTVITLCFLIIKYWIRGMK
jgi:hypothetical protein